MIALLLGYADIGQLVLRLAVGIPIALHGYSKIKTFKDFSGWLGSMGFKPAGFWTAMVILAEFVGGILVAIGAFTQIAAFLIAVNMLVAILAVNLGKKKFIGGWELDVMYLAGAVALMVLGAGAWSVDSFLNIWIY